jgi:hypothetical protein
MTFFSLKAADQVVIPLAKPTEAAYALASIRRLIQVYKHSSEKFMLAAVGDLKAIERIVYAKNRESENLKGIKITAWDSRKIKGALDRYLSFDQGEGQSEVQGAAVGREPEGKAAAKAGPEPTVQKLFSYEKEMAWGALLNEEVSAWTPRRQPAAVAGSGSGSGPSSGSGAGSGKPVTAGLSVSL